MDNRERMIKIFNHEEPDRCLVHHRGILPNGTFYQDWMRTIGESDEVEEYVDYIPEFGDQTLQTWCAQDTVFGGIPIVVGYSDVPLLEAMEGYDGDHPVLRDFQKDKDLSKCRVSWCGHVKESTIHNGLGYSWYHTGFFKTKEIREDFYERYGNPFEEKYRPKESYTDNFRKKLKTLEDMNYRKIMVSQTGSFWENIMEGFSLGGIGRLMRKDPAFVDKLCEDYEKIIEYSWKLMLEAAQGYEPIIIGTASDLGQRDRPLINPKQWARFIKPHYSKLMDVAHKKGCFTWQHCCGFMEPLLPDLIEAGLDAIQSLEPQAGVDIERVKENHGDKIVLVGGMDSTNTLSFGTVDDVIADAKKCMKAGMPGGGYFAGTSHRIIDCPIENVRAMVDTILKYRDYPCRL
jgi:hypothetical protein